MDRHGSLWLSYASPDTRPGAEYTRAYLQMHDGYVFGSGYGISVETRLQSLVDEAVQLYEMEGEDAYPLITSMEGTLQLVAELDNTILAFAGWPQLVGLSVGDNLFDQDQEEILQYLGDHPGLWSDSVDPLNVAAVEMRRSAWTILYDGHLFSASRVYSPETAAIEIVDAAIALYKDHGEEAFDRITWQSVRPELIYPFAHVAETWELVAHAAVPERVGVCCAAPIAASNDLDVARQDLEQNPGIWLEYTFYNPITERYEYKRTYLATYDGYTFAAGFYYGNFEQSERTIQEAIDLYDTQGKDAAFADINAMMTDAGLSAGLGPGDPRFRGPRPKPCPSGGQLPERGDGRVLGCGQDRGRSPQRRRYLHRIQHPEPGDWFPDDQDHPAPAARWIHLCCRTAVCRLYKVALHNKWRDESIAGEMESGVPHMTLESCHRTA